MSFFKSLIRTPKPTPIANWRQPVETLEGRQLLSAAVGHSAHTATSSPAIVAPLGSPVKALTINAVDTDAFSGPVAIWVGSLPKASAGLKAQASIDWGDGSSSAGKFVVDGGGIIQINGSHAYTAPGIYHTVITVTESPVGKPGQPLPQFIILVGQADGTAIVARKTAGSVTIDTNVGQPFSGTVAHLDFHVPTGKSVGVYAASIDWGDGTTTNGTFASPTPGGHSDVVGSHTYAEAGTFTLHIVVSYGPRPGSGAEFPTRIVATIDSLAHVANRVSLDGTVVGTYKTYSPIPDVGVTYNFTGIGTAGAVGPVALSGSASLPGFIATGKAVGTLTLNSLSASSAAGGSVTLSVTGPTEMGFGPFPATLNYVITGGTGTFANASGNGTISVTLDPLNKTPNGFVFVIHSA